MYDEVYMRPQSNLLLNITHKEPKISTITKFRMFEDNSYLACMHDATAGLINFNYKVVCLITRKYNLTSPI